LRQQRQVNAYGRNLNRLNEIGEPAPADPAQVGVFGLIA